MDQVLPAAPNGSTPPISGLPSYLTSFLGREDDIARLRDLLLAPNVRLVTVTGFGGIGKTRLAVELIARMNDDWQRIWFVPLAHLHEANAANSLIDRELNTEDDGTLADHSIRHDLQTAPCLLVLDNFEHLVDAADQIPALLRSWPLLTILVTSRTPLNLSGEHVAPLASLALTSDTPGSAIQLFRERARAHGASIGPEDGATVEQICRRLEGIPLAIELAAARAPSISLVDLRNRLTSQLSLLTGGPRDAPARQRTLRDTIAWSYDLLGPPEQQVLQGLSVFSGGFTIDAAASVLDIVPSTMMDHLSSLIASSLVLPAPSDMIPVMRYRLLDPVREYAFDQLQIAGHADEMRLAHARFFTRFAEDALPLYDGPDLPLAMQSVCLETDNFRAAMAYSLSQGNREDGVRLAGALWRHWPSPCLNERMAWRDRMAEGHRWITLALQHTADLPPAAVREAVIGNLFLSARTAKHAAIPGDLAMLKDLANSDGDPYTTWWAEFLEFRIRRDLTVPIEHAEEKVARWLDLASQCRQPHNQRASILLETGWLLRLSGQQEQALPLIRRGYEEAILAGSPLFLSMGAQLMAEIAIDEGDLHQALNLLRDMNRYELSLGPYFTLSTFYLPLIRVALHAGHHDLARELITTRQSIVLTEDDEHLPGEGIDRILVWRQQVLAEFRAVAGEQAYLQVVSALPAQPQHLVSEIIDELDRHLVTVPVPPIHVQKLTDRECEVLRLLARGDSNRAIADALFISERTVENHVRSILGKLEVANRAGAAAWAVRHDLG